MLVVINKDSLMRRRLCGKLHGGPSQLLFALHLSSIDSQIFVDNRDFLPIYLHSTPLYGGPRRNITRTFGTDKLEWCGYRTVKNEDIGLFIRFDKIHERDGWIHGQTDRQTPHDGTGRTRLCAAKISNFIRQQ